MTAVVIGIDPHKRSNTALVLDPQENVLAKQRFPNDRDGYRELKRFAQPWRDRTWAVEGARGVDLAEDEGGQDRSDASNTGSRPCQRLPGRTLSGQGYRATLSGEPEWGGPDFSGRADPRPDWKGISDGRAPS